MDKGGGGETVGPRAAASAVDEPAVVGHPDPSRSNRDAMVGLLFVQVFFGTLPVVGQLAFPYFPPLALAALRVGGATLIMGAIWAGLGAERVARRHLVSLALFAVFGIVGNQLLFMMGLARTDPVSASVLVTTIPVFTLLVAVVARVEKPGPRKVAGIGLGFAGVLVLVGVSPAALTGGHALGNLLVTLNSLSYAIYLVLARNLVRTYKPLTVAVWTFAFGSLVIIPVGMPTLVQIGWASIPLSAWASLAFIIMIPTVGAYVINNWALGKVAPSTVAVYIYLQPPVAALLAYLVFGFVPGVRTLVGALLIFLGVYAAAVSRKSGRLSTFGRSRV